MYKSWIVHSKIINACQEPRMNDEQNVRSLTLCLLSRHNIVGYSLYNCVITMWNIYSHILRVHNTATKSTENELGWHYHMGSVMLMGNLEKSFL